MSRIHVAALKGSNTAASNSWLQKQADDRPCREKRPSGSAALAMARCAMDREAQKRTALLERREPGPIDSAVRDIVDLVKSGRMNVDDLVATQRRELDRLQALRVMHGRNEESVRLAALTQVRQQAIDVVKKDPFMSVVAPGAAKVAEANDCHKPGGSPDGGQFCSTGGGDQPGREHFDSYHDAASAARARANQTGHDVAIRKASKYDRPGFIVRFASINDSDYARAEIVKPDQPKARLSRALMNPDPGARTDLPRENFRRRRKQPREEPERTDLPRERFGRFDGLPSLDNGGLMLQWAPVPRRPWEVRDADGVLKKFDTPEQAKRWAAVPSKVRKEQRRRAEFRKNPAVFRWNP